MPKLLSMRKLAGRAARRVVGTITHVRTDQPVVALTFDDGPDPIVTPQLLDILQKHGAHATFFVVGKAADSHPSIVKRMAEEGHSIGNHSWDHSSLPALAGRKRRASLRACRRAAAPYGARLLRPPYGEQNLLSRVDGLVLGCKVIGWSVAARDYHGDAAQTLVERVQARVAPGDIILFHDALFAPRRVDAEALDRRPTLLAVDVLLERYRGRFQFVTVPELLQHGRPQRELWFTPGLW